MGGVFSVSALFRHQRMFLGGRIFRNRVVYKRCGVRNAEWDEISNRVFLWQKAESDDRNGGTMIKVRAFLGASLLG